MPRSRGRGSTASQSMGLVAVGATAALLGAAAYAAWSRRRTALSGHDSSAEGILGIFRSSTAASLEEPVAAGAGAAALPPLATGPSTAAASPSPAAAGPKPAPPPLQPAEQQVAPASPPLGSPARPPRPPATPGAERPTSPPQPPAIGAPLSPRPATSEGGGSEGRGSGTATPTSLGRRRSINAARPPQTLNTRPLAEALQAQYGCEAGGAPSSSGGGIVAGAAIASLPEAAVQVCLAASGREPLREAATAPCAFLPSALGGSPAATDCDERPPPPQLPPTRFARPCTSVSRSWRSATARSLWWGLGGPAAVGAAPFGEGGSAAAPGQSRPAAPPLRGGSTQPQRLPREGCGALGLKRPTAACSGASLVMPLNPPLPPSPSLPPPHQDITGELGDPTALDVGCMAGALTFGMAARCAPPSGPRKEYFATLGTQEPGWR
jgi:hypothetical protein